MVANDLMVRYNDSIVDTDDVLSAIWYYSNSSRFIKNHDGNDIEISSILGFSTIPQRTPTLLNAKYITAIQLYKIRDYLLDEYECTYELSSYKNVLSTCRRYWDKKVTIGNLSLSSNMVAIYNKSFSEIKRKYVKELWKQKHVKFIKKTTSFTLFSKKKHVQWDSQDLSCYYDLLELKNYDKSDWRAVIVEFQTLLQNITNLFIDLDAIDIPDSWVSADKAKSYKPKLKSAKVGKTKEKGDVNVKEAVSPERETASNAKFVPVTYDGKYLNRRKTLTIYAKEEDRSSLDYLFGLFKKVESEIKFVIMSDREIKVLEMYGLNNFMPLSTFLKGDNKPFKRMMTALLIDNLNTENSSTFACKDLLSKLSASLSDDLCKLFRYSKSRISYTVKETVKLDLEEYAAKNNLYDMEIFNTYSCVKKLLVKNPFINVLCSTMKGYTGNALYNEGIMIVMKDMCRYKHVRMNLSNYQLVKEQEVNQLDIS